MKRIIVAAIMALLLSVGSLFAQNSETIYIIDGQKVENFDGSQLVGKVIVAYGINNSTKVHTILTEDNKVVSNSVKVSSDEVVYVVDGVVKSGEEYRSLSPSEIKSVTVVKKTDSPVFQQFAKKGTKTVLIVRTK